MLDGAFPPVLPERGPWNARSPIRTSLVFGSANAAAFGDIRVICLTVDLRTLMSVPLGNSWKT